MQKTAAATATTTTIIIGPPRLKWYKQKHFENTVRSSKNDFVKKMFLIDF